MRLYRLIMITIWGMAWALFLMGCKKPETPKVSQLENQTKINQEQRDKQEAELLLKELRQKNPFRPDHVSGLVQEFKGEAELKGIIWDSQRPSALIGDTMVVEGDYIGGKKVIKIDKDSVILEDEGRQTVLKLEGVPE